jgi:hypothetical protein
VFRRLARKLVIFMFICGFLSAIGGMVYNWQHTKPDSSIVSKERLVFTDSNTDTNAKSGDPYAAFGGQTLDSIKPCPVSNTQWTPINPRDMPCRETQAESDARVAWAKAQAEQDASNRRIGVLFIGLYGFIMGGLAGIILWVLYRAARFAITG